MGNDLSKLCTKVFVLQQKVWKKWLRKNLNLTEVFHFHFCFNEEQKFTLCETVYINYIPSDRMHCDVLIDIQHCSKIQHERLKSFMWLDGEHNCRAALLMKRNKEKTLNHQPSLITVLLNDQSM